MFTLAPILSSASRGKGVDPSDISVLLDTEDEPFWQAAAELATTLTRQHFSRVIQLFAPLYFSNFCLNNCTYCGFRRDNTTLNRLALTESAILREAKVLWQQGHRTILLIAGEHPAHARPAQVAGYARLLRRHGFPFHFMVELAPQTVEGYQLLRASGIEHALLFQETYDRPTYNIVHPAGPKQRYEWRLHAMERALEAGVRRVGLGILLGLHDYRFDVMQLIQHCRQIYDTYGVFPATISLPRIQPAGNAPISFAVPHPVSDEEFVKIIVTIRLALPRVGIVLTTREHPTLRDAILKRDIGITHLSAGSSTVPGGYSHPQVRGGQFELADERSLSAVVAQLAKEQYIPQLSSAH